MTDALAKRAVAMAIHGAQRYLMQHNLDAPNERLSVELNRHVTEALPQALADAKQALDCGMGVVAEQTFAASMALAGMAAAKGAGAPRAAIPA